MIDLKADFLESLDQLSWSDCRQARAEPIRIAADGTVAVPDTPGLGIEIDEDKLAHYGEKYFEITSRGLAIKTIRDKGLFTALRLARKKRR